MWGLGYSSFFASSGVIKLSFTIESRIVSRMTLMMGLSQYGYIANPQGSSLNNINMRLISRCMLVMDMVKDLSLNHQSIKGLLAITP